MEYFGLCQMQVAVGSKAKNLKGAKRHASLGNVSNKCIILSRQMACTHVFVVCLVRQL